ncbi:NUDIX hydrolase [Microbacterium maritypicum]|uniref:NUDIX hydrolase n=1 Tax=Microbacterium maritypicum TaxID=33918 RepID=UPI001B341B56|nr:NUDIX hydrolase [Microbacterium liquefaciens]MBP5802687.1 NUDIX hydrolase [Microbacterium liquefaciens]
MSAEPAAWTTIARRTVVEDRWIGLRADDCEDTSGRSIAPYYVLEYGDWISVLALDGNDDAIVVEEYRHGAAIVAIGTIGGGVEPGESPEDAAARELLEETGFESDDLIGLGATWANFGNHTNRVHHFLARGCRRIAEQSLDDGESIAVHVLSLDGLGDRLVQSYHQLTWYKAMDWLGR